MKQTILLIALFLGLASRNGLGQNVNTHQAAPVDTAAGAPAKTNSQYGSMPIDSKRLLSLWLGSGNAGQGVWLGTYGNHALYFFTDSSKAGITLHPSGKVQFGNSIQINGTTTTKILTVTGGADLAEPFSMSENNFIPAGAVVVIDEQNPGKLKLCRKAYDTRVAGVVSGAGGVNPGLTLQQEGMFGEGPMVTLTGRVYALATVANGPIRPGDLLTTSEVPGHAMKATDKALAYGAIVGKALTALEANAGLILILVNLH